MKENKCQTCEVGGKLYLENGTAPAQPVEELESPDIMPLLVAARKGGMHGAAAYGLLHVFLAREKLAAVEQAKQIIVDLTEEDDCQYDHHGYCQTHGWMAAEPTCPHKRAKEFLNQFKEEMK